jgi:hypothetical protein
MERRDFIQKSIFATTAIAGAGLSSAAARTAAKSKEVYEFRTYEMRRNQAPLDNYFSKGLIPTLNRFGIKNVGAFSEWSKSEPAKIYLLIPYASVEDFVKTREDLKADRDFAEATREYDQIPLSQALFDRYDSSLLMAFDGHPKMTIPSGGPRLFELRSYESYSEDAARRKIKMFNDHEFEIFDRVKLNPVFFGENMSGKNLPCLTYMIVFKDMEERDQAWKAFGSDPDWQKVSKLPEFADTVQKIHKIFFEPLPYSQI